MGQKILQGQWMFFRDHHLLVSLVRICMFRDMTCEVCEVLVYVSLPVHGNLTLDSSDGFEFNSIYRREQNTLHHSGKNAVRWTEGGLHTAQVSDDMSTVPFGLDFTSKGKSMRSPAEM